MKTALVLGGGGFIGSHMVTQLKNEGYFVRALDVKLPEFSTTSADEFEVYDLTNPEKYEDFFTIVIIFSKSVFISIIKIYWL